MDEKTKLAAEIARDITVAALEGGQGAWPHNPQQVSIFYSTVFRAVHLSITSEENKPQG